MRLSCCFSESIRSLGANLSTTVAATMTVLIGMFLLGLFIALGSWAQAFGDKQKEKLLVKVYFCTESTCAASRRRRSRSTPCALKPNQDPLVREVTFVSKAEALDRMRKLQPDIVENLPVEPAPGRVRGDGARRRDVKAISQNLRDPRCRPASRRSTTARRSPTASSPSRGCSRPRSRSRRSSC